MGTCPCWPKARDGEEAQGTLASDSLKFNDSEEDVRTMRERAAAAAEVCLACYGYTKLKLSISFRLELLKVREEV